MGGDPPDRNGPEAWRRAIHSFVRRFGLLEDDITPCGQPLPTSHAHALMELLRDPGLTQKDLAERLGLTKSGSSRLLSRLEATGRVVRRVDDADNRAKRVSLTDKGRALTQKVEQASLLRFASLIEGIPVARRKTVLECLDLLSRATPDPVGGEGHEG